MLQKAVLGPVFLLLSSPPSTIYKSNHAMHFQCKAIGGNALQKLILINLCFSISLFTFPQIFTWHISNI